VFKVIYNVNSKQIVLICNNIIWIKAYFVIEYLVHGQRICIVGQKESENCDVSALGSDVQGCQTIWHGHVGVSPGQAMKNLFDNQMDGYKIIMMAIEIIMMAI